MCGAVAVKKANLTDKPWQKIWFRFLPVLYKRSGEARYYHFDWDEFK